MVVSVVVGAGVVSDSFGVGRCVRVCVVVRAVIAVVGSVVAMVLAVVVGVVNARCV